VSKQVQVTMWLDSPKKHSTLFKPASDKHSTLFKPASDETQPAITGLYLMNTAFKELGEPTKITITIEEA